MLLSYTLIEWMVFYGLYHAERQRRVAPARTVRAGNVAPRIRQSGNARRTPNGNVSHWFSS